MTVQLCDSFDWGQLEMAHPAPGDPDIVRSTAFDLTEMSRIATEIHVELARVGMPTSMWTGVAADSFSQRVDVLLADLGKLMSSFERAGGALNRYATGLENARELATSAALRADRAIESRRDADRQVSAGEAARRQRGEALATAERELERANADHLVDCMSGGVSSVGSTAVVSATHARSDAEAALRQTTTDLAAAKDALAAARADLAAATDDARLAFESRRSAAHFAAEGIDDASDLGIGNRSTVRRFWDATLGDTISELDDAIEFLTSTE
ncbi:MAG: hypothetical protein OEY23_13330, partial [Acidimicrobiia bacterium]|nr:hypothetical protein [Acidimicrobiia bacterium]